MDDTHREEQQNMESIVGAVDGWGYRVFPREDGDFGYARLLVAIRKEPTERHFDPERLRFRLQDATGEVRWRTASWRMPVEHSGRLVAGPVMLTDRHRKEVEFFTFGGRTDHVTSESALVYVFDSSAPILEFAAGEETVSDQLAYEVEGILAGLEEQYEERCDRGFEKRLAETDPFSLYVALVDAILARYDQASGLEEAFHTLHDALRTEKRTLRARGAWPESSPGLRELVLEDVGSAMSALADEIESQDAK